VIDVHPGKLGGEPLLPPRKETRIRLAPEPDPMPLLQRIALTLLALALPTFPASAIDEPRFNALFNGKDLTGWRFGNDVLDGKTEASDGRFKVDNGTIVITGATRAGQAKMEAIDTLASFAGDFILRLEFRAGRDANSGLHLRDHEFKHQLQIRDYPRVGPYKGLKHYKEGDWNAIEVTVKHTPDGTGALARCTCNGEVLEEALPIPAQGPIGLQSETNTVEYRNLRVRSLD
jgi:hypothetical protein